MLEDVVTYEYCFNSYEDFIASELSASDKKDIHLKALRYYKTQCVDDRDFWITSKVKQKQFQEEFENLKQLLGSSDEKNRVIGLEIAKHMFQFNRDEIGYLMIHHYYSEESLDYAPSRVITWSLDGSEIIQMIDPKGHTTIHYKSKNSKNLRQLASFLRVDYRYIPRLLDNYFINL